MIKITRCLEPLPLAKVREDELQRVRAIARSRSHE